MKNSEKKQEATKKKPYLRPELSMYGKISTITNATNQGRIDDGATTGPKRSVS